MCNPHGTGVLHGMVKFIAPQTSMILLCDDSHPNGGERKPRCTRVPAKSKLTIADITVTLQTFGSYCLFSE